MIHIIYNKWKGLSTITPNNKSNDQSPATAVRLNMSTYPPDIYARSRVPDNVEMHWAAITSKASSKSDSRNKRRHRKN